LRLAAGWGQLPDAASSR